MSKDCSGKGGEPGKSAGPGLVKLRRAPTLAPSSSAASGEASRRDFLSMMGFTLGAAGLAAGCRAPTQRAIPLAAGTDQMVAGVANWYATTCGGCSAACGLLVKQRDGRPIKIEGNPESPLSGGGACATGQASVLSLYDDERLRGPVWQGHRVSWAEMDQHVSEALRTARDEGRKVVLLSATVTSPSTRRIIEEWGAKDPNFRHVTYDAVSLSGLRTAAIESFGRAGLPHYAFDRARVIVGLDADFLGTWLSPVEFARQYAKTRRSDDGRSHHVQIESGFSVTGSNADLRIAVAPSEIGLVAIALLRRVASKAGSTEPTDSGEPADAKKLDAVADALWKHRGESLVVSGANDVSTQVVVNALNTLLGNIGKTVDFARPSLQRQGDDEAMARLVDQMDQGSVHTLIMCGVNPAYDYLYSERFLRGLEKVTLSVSLSDRLDETSSHTHAVCPDHHFLEAWGDAEPVAGYLSLVQPVIAPLFDTRSAAESLLKWIGKSEDYYSYLRAFWRTDVFPHQKDAPDFDTFWDRALERGSVVLAPSAPTSPTLQGDWKRAARDIADGARQGLAPSDHYELHCYESVSQRDGRHANNPWLQELPDPITTVTWGNFAAIAPETAAKLSLKDGDVVTLRTPKGAVDVPVALQPGQHPQTISVALGYGRRLVGKAGQNIGANVYPLTVAGPSSRRYFATGATLAKTGRRDELARTQSHFSMEGRPIVQETTLTELEKGRREAKQELPTLWAEHSEGEHTWGMSIDLDQCIGCSACVVACQAENNVPVVGKEEVKRTRIMHWIRIDRYYGESPEEPAAVHQPMMCQHCANAPCETVCPVLATTTSSEGLNQQIYNRCIGTRYCANNCPYKVRRFNWYNYTQNPQFDYNMESPVGRLVLNPDVVVRTRGVMEKCSLCVQRIQLAKNTALREKRKLVDGDIQTACQQSCPTQAIVFGDLKDPTSRVSKLMRGERSYEVLEELGTRPNVSYLKKIRGENT